MPSKEKQYASKLDDVVAYNKANEENTLVLMLYNHWLEHNVQRLRNLMERIKVAYPHLQTALDKISSSPINVVKLLVRKPEVQCWMNAMEMIYNGANVTDIDNRPIEEDLSFITEDMMLALEPISSATEGQEVHVNRPWLRKIFGQTIIFEDEEIALKAKPVLEEALQLIREYNPLLYEEMLLLSPAIQFIKDPTAHPDKVVSFSDDTVPGCLYVGVQHRDNLVNPFDLADSLIHEHRHQKLYILETFYPIVDDAQRVMSPWRGEMRPVSGLFHAVFVFHQLHSFWKDVYTKSKHLNQRIVLNNLEMIENNLRESFHTLGGCTLTPSGKTLLNHFEEDLMINKL